MAYAYFDTSALIKRYVTEPGRREVLQLLRRNECVVSAVLPVEVRSALRRRVAEGTLDATRVPRILKRFTADRAFWTFVEDSREVLAAAEALCAAHPLRALDAIHVATAEVLLAEGAGEALEFWTHDDRQAIAALSRGLTVRGTS